MNYKIGVILDAKGAATTVSELNKVDSKLNSFGQTAKNALASFSGNLAADAVQKIASLAVEAGGAVFSFSTRMEQMKVGFATLTGGAQQAAKHLADLQRFAVDTPFEFEALTKMSQRLQGVGIEAKNVIPLMKDIGNVIAATGDMSAERVDGITTAISQMIGKQKVSAEEMEQLIERGVPAWNILSEAIGKPQAELRKLAEQGRISSDLMVAALQKIGREKFADAMEKQSKTFLGAFSTIKDTLLQTSSNAFQPWYDEISKFTVRFSQEIQKNGKDLESVGATIANYIGQGLAAALPAIAVAQGKNVVNVFKKTFTGEWSGFGFYAIDFFRGVYQEIAGETQAAFDEMRKGAEASPDLAAIFKADQAKKQAEDLKKTISELSEKIIFFGEQTEVAATKQKLFAAGIDFNNALAKQALALAARIDQLKETKKQTDQLATTVKNLFLQVEFFGDESQAAATKQQLLTQGITDLNSGLAQQAILWAERLDQLKKNKEETDKFDDKLRSFGSELKSIRDKADFDLNYPNPTALDEFNYKVRQSGLEFSSLKSEIDATRESLRMLAMSRAYTEAGAVNEKIFQGLKTSVEEYKDELLKLSSANISPFQQKLKDLLGTTELFNAAGEKINPRVFFATIEAKVRTYQAELQKVWDDGNALGLTPEEIEKQAAPVVKKWSEVLNNMLFSARQKVVDEKGNLIKFTTIFEGSEGLAGFTSQLINLYNVSSRLARAEGLKKFGDEMKSLGLAVGSSQDEFDRFKDWVEDPNLAESFEKYAASVNMTAEAFKELVLQQKAAQLGLTRPRIVGQAAEENPFKDGLFGALGIEKIRTEAETIKAIYEDMGATVGGIIAQMAQGVGSLVEAWVLYGDAGPDALRKMTAQVLASVAAQAAVKAIFELAEGFAALFFNPAEAAAHFTAAALYGSIAGVAAVAGRAVAGDSFKQGSAGASGGSQNQPDYYTVGSNQNLSSGLRETNQNFGVGDKDRALRADNKRIADGIDALNSKLDSVPFDHVLKVSAKRNGPFIRDVVIDSLKSNGSKASEMGKALRMT